MEKTVISRPVGFNAVSFERNFGKRGLKRAICDECGKEFLTTISYTKGRAILCRECLKDKIIFK